MTCKNCEKPTTGNSKYCREHAKEAQSRWVEMIKAKSEERTARNLKHSALLQEAAEAGSRAGLAVTPTPMVVEQHANPADDGSPVTKSWVCEGGICGFGSVRVRPANCSFALWAVKEGRAEVSHYSGGITFRSPFSTQSYEIHNAWANAFAEVLNRAGIKAYNDSRID